MKLVSYRHRSEDRAGAVVAGRVVDLAPILQGGRDMLALLRAGPDALAAAAAHAQRASGENAAAHPFLAEVELLAPVPRPPKIVAIGRNYADHAGETGMEELELPRLIAKLPSAVTGRGSVRVRPESIAKLDY